MYFINTGVGMVKETIYAHRYIIQSNKLCKMQVFVQKVFSQRVVLDSW